MVDTTASLVHWTGHLHRHRNHTTPGFACKWTIACVFRQTGDQLTFQPWPNEQTIRGNTLVCSNGNKQACLFDIFVILGCIWHHKHAVPGRMKMSLHMTDCLHIHHLRPQRRLLCISSFTFPLFLGTSGSNWNKKCKQMIVCESIICAARQICGTYKQLNMQKCPLMLSYGAKFLPIKDNCRRWTFHQHWNYILVFKIASLWIQILVWVYFAAKNASVCSVKPWQKSFWNYTCTEWPHVRGFEKHFLGCTGPPQLCLKTHQWVESSPSMVKYSKLSNRMKVAYCAQWASSMSDRKCCECWVKESCCSWTFSVGVQVMETGHCRAAETVSYYFPPSTWAVFPMQAIRTCVSRMSKELEKT